MDTAQSSPAVRVPAENLLQNRQLNLGPASADPIDLGMLFYPFRKPGASDSVLASMKYRHAILDALALKPLGFCNDLIKQGENEREFGNREKRKTQ